MGIGQGALPIASQDVFISLGGRGESRGVIKGSCEGGMQPRASRRQHSRRGAAPAPLRRRESKKKANSAKVSIAYTTVCVRVLALGETRLN